MPWSPGIINILMQKVIIQPSVGLLKLNCCEMEIRTQSGSINRHKSPAKAEDLRQKRLLYNRAWAYKN